MSKKVKVLIGILLVLLIIISVIFVFNSRIKQKEYSNSNFRVKYDTTWKVKESKEDLLLVHKKTNSEMRIQCKILEDNYIDTKLSDIIDDIVFGIEEQNKDYKLINRNIGVSDKYDSYSFLYENANKQVEVIVYKKDAKVIIAYYEANSKYFDIVLVSADEIFNSIEFVFE